MKGKGTRFPSALIGIGVPPIKNLDGTILKVGVEKKIISKKNNKVWVAK